MANTKEYRVTRKDGTTLTMLLDEDDRAKYEKAGWKPTLTQRKGATEAGADLSAPTRRRATKAAKGDDDDKGDDTTVVE